MSSEGLALPRRHVVAAHQPAYLPWLGYFHRIARADTFVFLDDVQFEKNSYTNRNQIKTKAGPLWLTVPVCKGGHTSTTMLSTMVDDRTNWRRKHLESIRQAYSRAPHFEACFGRLEELYGEQEVLLKDVCLRHLMFWMRVLDLKTKVIQLHELQVSERKSALVLAICKALSADTYISGPFGRDYLDMALFQEAGVAVEFDRFVHPTYPQLHGAFVPNLGIVDAWMNLGGAISSLLAPTARGH